MSIGVGSGLIAPIGPLLLLSSRVPLSHLHRALGVRHVRRGDLSACVIESPPCNNPKVAPCSISGRSELSPIEQVDTSVAAASRTSFPCCRSAVLRAANSTSAAIATMRARRMPLPRRRRPLLSDPPVVGADTSLLPKHGVFRSHTPSLTDPSARPRTPTPGLLCCGRGSPAPGPGAAPEGTTPRSPEPRG